MVPQDRHSEKGSTCVTALSICTVLLAFRVCYFDLSRQHKPPATELGDYHHLCLGLLTWIVLLV